MAVGTMPATEQTVKGLPHMIPSYASTAWMPTKHGLPCSDTLEKILDYYYFF